LGSAEGVRQTALFLYLIPHTFDKINKPCSYGS
jgi:hypothetical protein